MLEKYKNLIELYRERGYHEAVVKAGEITCEYYKGWSMPIAKAAKLLLLDDFLKLTLYLITTSCDKRIFFTHVWGTDEIQHY